MSYWDKRQILLENLMRSKTNYTMAEISKLYDDASNKMLDQIYKTFSQYQNIGNISPEYAVQLLSQKQTSEYRTRLVDMYNSANDSTTKLAISNILEAPAYAYRIKRLNALQNDLIAQCRMLCGKEQSLVNQRLEDILKQSYYRTIFNSEQEKGEHSNLDELTDNRVKAMLAHNWKGNNYSDRLWKNNDLFAEKIAKTLEVGCLSGQPLNVMCDYLVDEVIGSNTESGQRYITERLVRTETNYFANQGIKIGLQKAGYEKYRFVATLDMRTSDICESMDGKEFLLSEANAGENYPPMHPNCRSVVSPVDERVDRSKATRSARDPKTGKSIKVPANMTYQEWYSKFVENGLNESSQNDKIIRSSGKQNPDSLSKLLSVKKMDFNEENINKMVDDFAKEHAYSNVEFANVLTPRGNLYKVEGAKYTVDVESYINADELKGSVAIHNHPVNSGEEHADSFSIEDLESSLKNQTSREYLVTGTNKHCFIFNDFNMNIENLNELYSYSKLKVFDKANRKLIPSDYFEQYETIKILSDDIKELEFYEL